MVHGFIVSSVRDLNWRLDLLTFFWLGLHTRLLELNLCLLGLTVVVSVCILLIRAVTFRLLARLCFFRYSMLAARLTQFYASAPHNCTSTLSGWLLVALIVADLLVLGAILKVPEVDSFYFVLLHSSQ